jgi:hypothetical protein
MHSSMFGLWFVGDIVLCVLLPLCVHRFVGDQFLWRVRVVAVCRVGVRPGRRARSGLSGAVTTVE